MKKQPRSFEVEVEFEGENHSASYTVSSKVVTAHSFYGSGSTPIGGSGTNIFARMLLLEILRGAKARG